ncbi:MAG: hypothetical protein ACJAUV_000983 [Flavobacteriales bacterium]|jgi:hypothetical protein
MKKVLLALTFLTMWGAVFSQNDTIAVQDTTTYRIIKTDGGELIGKILKEDAREILFLTNDQRKIYIPQHAIKNKIALDKANFNKKGVFIGEDKFATRYFISTNGLPIKKGEHYVQWNLFGPDFQFGLGKNVGVGFMTTWFGTPMIGTIKKSWEIGEKTQVAIGGLFGTGSWVSLNNNGAVPFATLSFGDRSKNIAISGGYGALWLEGKLEGRAIASIAGMIKISPKLSLVFDSFILLPGRTETTNENGYNTNNKKQGLALLIPGVRWHQKEGRAIQFGFTAIVMEGGVAPVPIPMVQWYRSL